MGRRCDLPTYWRCAGFYAFGFASPRLCIMIWGWCLRPCLRRGLALIIHVKISEVFFESR